MNVLVYGSSGFVGRHLRAHLLSLGHSIIEGGRDYPLIPGLIADEIPIDALVNCAGEITEHHKMYLSNVALVDKLLRFARDAKIPKVIHIGSSSEYGNTTAPRCEGTPCQPVDLYSATKIAATALCEGFARQYDMDVCVARPFSLYGPGDTPRKLVPRLLSGEKVRVHPLPMHDYVYIGDFVYGLVTLLHAPRSKTQGDIVNMGSGIATSNWSVVNQMLEIGLDPKVEYTHRTDEPSLVPVFDWKADTSHARQCYGWTAKTSLADGLRRTASLS